MVHRQSQRRLPERDPYLLPLVSLLTGWGLVTIWRLSTNFGYRQTAWMALCLVLLVIGFRFPNILELLRRFKYIWLSCGLLLTGLTFLFGTYPESDLVGPRLWLGCCGVYIQPSEPLKLLVVVFLAAYLANNLYIQTSFIQLVTPILVMAGMAMLLLVGQHDLGTAVLFVVIFTVVLYLASGKKRVLVMSGLIILAATLFGYFYFDVVRVRLEAWVNPWLDPSGRSYQIVQSILAIANGGILGQGIGLGNPGVVPVAQSDFIYSAISEETGLLGVFGLILCEVILTARGIRVALYASNAYHRYLAAGLTSFLVAQSLLIIGGNIRLLPLTGVTLPFVSYGGSSLLTGFTALLLLLHISNHPDQESARVSNVQPYLVIGTVLMAGLMAAGLIHIWWSVVRSSDLLMRSDNPRRAIADRYVMRGTIYDRNEAVIDTTQGQVGDYQRAYLYPALSSITGYTNATFGQAGLEDFLDPTLRGMAGYPYLTIWWSNLLYGHPPTGLDTRLSLDLTLQQSVDDLLGDRAGAVVVINPQTGELLAMASHPYFDANTLESDFIAISADSSAPLLDRVTQGQYAPGTTAGLFLWAAADVSQTGLSLPGQLDVTVDGTSFTCARTAQSPVTWSTALAAACPGAVTQIGENLGLSQVLENWEKLGFYSAPAILLPAAVPSTPNATASVTDLILGPDEIKISPIQMAIAASAISQNGYITTPQLVSAIKDPSGSWQNKTGQEDTQQALDQMRVSAVLEAITLSDGSGWDYVGLAQLSTDHPVTWYLAGTLPGAVVPRVVVVTLETNDPAAAEKIGQGILSAISSQAAQ